MNIISMKVASAIAFAHQEITKGEALLKELRDGKKWGRPVDFRDAFGSRRELQLGIPSGDNAHRLYGVSPDLADYVIEAHVAKKRAELAELCVKARMELDGHVTVEVEEVSA